MPGTGKSARLASARKTPGALERTIQAELESPEVIAFNDSNLQATVAAQLQPGIYAYGLTFDPKELSPDEAPKPNKPQYLELPDESTRSTLLSDDDLADLEYLQQLHEKGIITGEALDAYSALAELSKHLDQSSVEPSNNGLAEQSRQREQDTLEAIKSAAREVLIRQREQQLTQRTYGHSAQLQQALDQTERESTGLDYERMHIFTQDGNLLTVAEGDAHSVTLSPEQIAHQQGHITTHNHPGPGGPGLSLTDVRDAIVKDEAEGRATDRDYRYSITPTPDVNWNQDLWNNSVLLSYAFHHKITSRDLVLDIMSGKLTYNEANAIFLHDIWTNVARDTGAFIYTREPWTPNAAKDKETP